MPPTQAFPYWRDALRANNKDMGASIQQFDSMSHSTLLGKLISGEYDVVYERVLLGNQ
jgi:hypothetical protein